MLLADPEQGSAEPLPPKDEALPRSIDKSSSKVAWDSKSSPPDAKASESKPRRNKRRRWVPVSHFVKFEKLEPLHPFQSVAADHADAVRTDFAEDVSREVSRALSEDLENEGAGSDVPNFSDTSSSEDDIDQQVEERVRALLASNE